MDASLKNCSDWYKTCVVSDVVKPWDAQTLSFEQFYRVDLPKPFAPREFLLQFQFVPDAKSNAVFLRVDGRPDDLPRGTCCMRIESVHNSWRFTQLSGGDTEAVMVEDADLGLPYFMFNMEAAEGAYDVFKDLPHLLNKPEYRDVKPEFIPANGTHQSRRWDDPAAWPVFSAR